MNRIVIAIFSALMLLAFPSQAQQIIVVASCPATLSPPLNQGAPGRLTVDVNGILCTNASGGGGGGAITAAANSYATGFSPDIGVFGSMVPYQGSGTANVINLLGGIEEDARGPLATQANSVSVGGVGILAPLGTTNIAASVAVTASTGALVDLYSAIAPTPYGGTGAAANITELEAIRQNSTVGAYVAGGTFASFLGVGGVLTGTGAEPEQMVASGSNYVYGVAQKADSTIIAGSTPGRGYNTIAASQTAYVLSATESGGTGAIGDYLSHCVAYPTSTSPGTPGVQVFDGSNSAGNLVINFPGGSSSLSNLSQLVFPVGAYSIQSGGWKVTTGSGLSVICYGKFS